MEQFGSLMAEGTDGLGSHLTEGRGDLTSVRLRVLMFQIDTVCTGRS